MEKNLITDLVKALKKDKGYRESWKANIAMAYSDTLDAYKRKNNKKHLNANDMHIIANKAAEYFLKQLCGELKYPKGR